MAQLGEVDIIDTIQLPMSPNGIASTLSSTAKLAVVQKLRQQPMKAGDTWFVVAQSWYKQWETVCIEKADDVRENVVGPVGNSLLLDKETLNVIALVKDIDAEFVCKEVWDLFVTWFRVV